MFACASGVNNKRNCTSSLRSAAPKSTSNSVLAISVNRLPSSMARRERLASSLPPFFTFFSSCFSLSSLAWVGLRENLRSGAASFPYTICVSYP